MDPFARDSETEDERPLRREADAGPGSSRVPPSQGVSDVQAQPASTSARRERSRSRQSRGSQPDGGDDEEDGPPASLVLDAHSDNGKSNEGGGERRSRSSRTKTSAVLGRLTSADEQVDDNDVRESVRLTRMGKFNGQRSDEHIDEEVGDVTAQHDEETGLMDGEVSSHGSPSGQRRSRRSRRPRDFGMLSRVWRKVQRGAEQIQAQDGMAAQTAARARNVANNGMSDGGGAARRLSAKDRALWRWGTLDNLDEFLQEAYAYYTGKGLACILLTKVFNLLTIAFVIGFSVFLTGCVDYSSIKHDGQLSDVIVAHCVSRFSGFSVLVFALFVGAYAWQVIRFGLGISKLVAMNHFYTYLLDVPDADVQAISWAEIVNRIHALREAHPTTSLSYSNDVAQSKLDAHDVANRIMRQENYLVALFNKDVLNLAVPLPGFSGRTPELTRSLEWNLSFCLLGFLFDSQGKVRKPFVQERYRAELIEGLRRRFIFMAVVNAVFAPFIVLYLLFYSFFRYFEEYHKNPSNLGSRQYTQFARWKFREFNELPHLFRRRCHNSYPFAQRYIDQFPKERTAILARFVSFVAGSFTAVLILASVIDPDLFVHFDITPQRNVLFYIGVFGAILAVSRALTPDDQMIFEPELMLRAVIEYTHYLPDHWKGRFHSAEVHADFGRLYRLKLSIFVSEILSVVVTPFILWKSLPKSAPGIIDFFREFTVHVDGLGYVCSFAVFDFNKHGNAEFGAPQSSRNKRMSSKEGKMEQSLLGFRHANPTWQPSDPLASVFLARLAADMTQAQETVLPSAQASAKVSQDGKTDEQGVTSSRRKASGAGTAVNAAPVNFTPANSVLAQRSQLYSDAFERSILLASKPSNALALQASAVKSGPRSVPPALAPSKASSGRYNPRERHSAQSHGLQAVDEDGDDGEVQGRGPLRERGTSSGDLDESDGAALLSTYEDAHPEAQQSATSSSARQGLSAVAREPANLRELMQHIGTSRW